MSVFCKGFRLIDALNCKNEPGTFLLLFLLPWQMAAAVDVPGDQGPRPEKGCQQILTGQELATRETNELLARVMAPAARSVRTLVELKSLLPLTRNFGFQEYLQYARSTGKYRFWGEVLEFYRKQASPSEFVKPAVAAGLIGFGAIVSQSELEHFLAKGVLTLDQGGFGHALKILTEAQLGQPIDALHLSGTEVLLVMDPETINGIQSVSVDQRNANSLARRFVPVEPSNLLDLTKVVKSKQKLDDLGWMRALNDSFKIAVWGLRAVISLTDQTETLRKKLTGKISPQLISDRIINPGPSGALTQKTLEFDEELVPSQAISLTNPFARDELSQLIFNGIARSHEIADWIHLMGSELEILWNSGRNQIGTKGKLIRVDSDAHNFGTIALTLREEDGQTRYISTTKISAVTLVHYEPNGSRPGTVSVPRALLEDPQVRELLDQERTDLSTKVRIQPQ